MVKQYPDSIVVTVKANPSQDTSTGLFTAGATTTKTYDCRAEINGGGGKYVGVDGAVYDYTFTVYMPRTTDLIPQDSDYILTVGGATYTGRVKGFSNGQLNSRIWL